MTAGTSASLCWTLQFVIVFIFVSADQEIITCESGQNVTLPCRAPIKNDPITAVEWSKPDLGDEYLLLYRDGYFDLGGQHPSFVNRVDLQDRRMKDGDVSLILKDVSTDDTGTYECEVFQKARDTLMMIKLSVVPPGQTGGDREDGVVGLAVVLSVSAVLLVAAVVVLLMCRKRRESSQPYQPPLEQQQTEMSQQ